MMSITIMKNVVVLQVGKMIVELVVNAAVKENAVANTAVYLL
jgi:hypothetical protein